MKGVILGDIIGSRFEFSKDRQNKSEDFELFTNKCSFTDDTVLTVATMDSILNNIPFDKSYRMWGNKYPDCSYGGSFRNWLKDEESKPYNSWGNGSAMRVSPIGVAYDDLKTVLSKAEESASVTHNHEEGIKGACATALCVYLAKYKTPKKIIKECVETYFGYNLSKTLDQIRPVYFFNESCQHSVPESIICFLESNSYEDCIRKVVSLGGDTDTMGAISGGIAELYYGIEDKHILRLDKYLTDDISYVVCEFYKRYEIK